MFKICLILILFLTVSTFAQTPSCENPEAKAFDWQIGTWQSEDGKQVHEIKELLDSCVIFEIWKTDGKETAVALKSFDDGRHNKIGEKLWIYSWVAKAFHQRWEGRQEEGQWRFYRNWFFNGEAVLSRTYWTQISKDKLERIVEQSRDEGKTWKPWVKDVFVRKTVPVLVVRNAHGFVYDENLQKTILFGGADSEKVLNDTWEFDSSHWQKIIAFQPQKRIENGH